MVSGSGAWKPVVAMAALGALAACQTEAFPQQPTAHPPGLGDSGQPSGNQPVSATVDPAQPTRRPTPCLDARVDPGPVGGPLDSSDGAARGSRSAGLVIFDKSGSMAGSWALAEELEEDPAAVPSSKWQAASDALVGAVTPEQHRVTLGALFFPTAGDDGCHVAPLSDPWQVSFRPGPEFLSAWDGVAPQNRPRGGTPLESALRAAEPGIEDACQKGLLEGRFYVILLTDGEPNCDTDLERVEARVGRWRDHGILTYVFGLPGSEGAQETLDRISRAGGTETVLVPGSPGELEEGIAVIM